MARKLALGAVLALVALMSASVTAGAATVEIDPAGRITSDSTGRFTFTSDIINTSCNVDLAGSLVETAIGRLTEEQEPSTNALIGKITGGDTENCTFGLTADMLFDTDSGTEGDWQIYARNHEGNNAFMYILHAKFYLRDVFNVIDCLIDALVAFTYDRVNGDAIVTNTVILNFEGDCPEQAGLEGSFVLDPQQSFEVR